MSRDSSIQNIQAPRFEGSEANHSASIRASKPLTNVQSEQQLIAMRYKPSETPNILNFEKSKIDLKAADSRATFNASFLTKVE
jgi:hypothetical protein